MNVSRMSGRRDLEVLPHRAPFLLVDRLEGRKDGEARALRRVTANDPLVGGTLPAPLVIEALAQTAALMHTEAHRGFLVALRNVKVHSDATPGDTLELSVVRTATLGALHRVKGEARVGERLVLTGELTFAIEGAT